MKILITTIIILFLSGCSSLELRNLGKTSLSTGTAFLIAGPVAGVGVLATAMAYDELIPDSPKVADIETNEQAVAYVATSWGTDAMYAFIAFLIITNILVPWITRRQG
ncbi:hypothetical protein AV947_gp42 [Podophage Lau218]|nr:hypothetical protein AV947_gp42 [Podophage Lau218]AIA83157.1 putative phage protein [Podophage Lau218]